MTKLRVGLLFGGCSGEHEVSIRSAKAIATALTQGKNTDQYELIPIYIQKDGRWQPSDFSQQVLDSDNPALLQLTNENNNDSNTSSNLWQIPPQTAQVDVWFPVLHGPNGEDGTIQGLLKLMQVPFVGSGVLGSAMGMDKIAMKIAFEHAGLPQVKYQAVTRSQIWSNPCIFPKLCDDIEAALGN